MKIEILLESSTEESVTKLIIKNIQENDNEVLLMIDSISGQQDIYVLLKDLKEALNKF